MAHHGGSARHTFFYLLILVTLGFVSTGAGTILFELIEALLPDASSYETLSQGSLKYGLSTIIIAAPLFWYITRQVNSELSKKELAPDSAVRRWLTYLILLISSVTLLGDLMVLVYSFLDGELTLRFVLKSLVVLVIAGLIFGYYLHDIRRSKFAETETIKQFRYAFAALMIVSLVGGFAIMDSPFQARRLREDDQRVNSLSQLRYEINDYYRQEDKLPENLQTVADRSYTEIINDPISGQPFEYQVVSEREYELCAEFQTSNRDDEENNRYYYGYEWYHDAGRECFKLRMDEEGKEIPPLRIPSS